MKKLLCIAIVLIALTNAADAQKIYKKVKINDYNDSVSYAIGLLLAQNFASQQIDMLNPDVIGKAFSDVKTNNVPLISKDNSTTIVQEFFDKMDNEKKDKAYKKEKEFLAKNSQEDGIKVTESGLQYRIIKEGTGLQPTDSSSVLVHYEGKLVDGTVFDSSFDNDDPVEFDLDYLIPGMIEALKMMKEGSEYIFYIPSELGYGEQSPAEIIPAYSTLIFDIELIKVKENSNTDLFPTIIED